MCKSLDCGNTLVFNCILPLSGDLQIDPEPYNQFFRDLYNNYMWSMPMLKDNLIYSGSCYACLVLNVKEYLTSLTTIILYILEYHCTLHIIIYLRIWVFIFIYNWYVTVVPLIKILFGSEEHLFFKRCNDMNSAFESHRFFMETINKV